MKKTLWMIAYRVESENSKSLKPKQRDWLRSQRVAIWYALRYKHKCVPIQHSLWLIRSKEAKAELEKAKETWLATYKQYEYSARIEIFPLQTNETGYRTFRQWEFDSICEWLQKMKDISASKKGAITKKNQQATEKKLQLLSTVLKEDFDENYPNWEKAQKLLSSIQNTKVELTR